MYNLPNLNHFCFQFDSRTHSSHHWWLHANLHSKLCVRNRPFLCRRVPFRAIPYLRHSTNDDCTFTRGIHSSYHQSLHGHPQLVHLPPAHFERVEQKLDSIIYLLILISQHSEKILKFIFVLKSIFKCYLTQLKLLWCFILLSSTTFAKKLISNK